MEKKRFFDQKLKSWLLISFAMSFMFCIFAPIDVFYANIEEFWFSLPQLLGVCFIVFLIGLGILSLCSLLFSKTKESEFLFAGFLGFFVYFYLQGNYAPRNYGVLNGSDINWDAFLSYAVISVVLFVVSIVLSFIVFAKFKKYLYKVGSAIGAFVVLIQIVTIVTLFINHGFNINEKEISTMKDYYSMSSDNNVIVFMLDTYDGADLSYLLDEDYDYQAQIFEDFTFYPDTLGTYPTTKCSLPYILTGRWYENEVPYADYVQASYVDNPIYEAFSENNWTIDMYTNVMYLCEDNSIYSNVDYGYYKISDKYSFAKKIFKLVLFNYAPHQLKSLFFTDTSVFTDFRTSNLPYPVFSPNVINFANTFNNSGLTVNRTGNVFKFYHTDGVHMPYTFGRGLVEDGGVYNSYDEAYGNNEILRAYFSALKEAGIYDSSTIIIMADHGHFDSSQNPVFAIKNANEHHPFAVSDVKMSWEYLEPIWIALANQQTVDENFIMACGEGRDSRRFLYYNWDDAWSRAYMPAMQEALLYTNVQDYSALEYSGQTYMANNENHAYSFGDTLKFYYGRNGYSYVLYGVADGNISHDAKMIFDFSKSYDNLQFEITLGPGNIGKRVQIYANDHLVAEKSMLSSDGVFRFIVPHEYVEDGHLELQFVQGELRDDAIISQTGNIISEIVITSTKEEVVIEDQIDDFEYDVGTELGFSFALNNGYAYCLDGFFDPGVNGAMVSMRGGTLRLNLTSSASDLDLIFHYIVTEDDKGVLVYCNDNLIDEFVTDGSGSRTIHIDSSLLKEDYQDIKIVLEKPDESQEDFTNRYFYVNTLTLVHSDYGCVAGSRIDFTNDSPNYASYVVSGLSIPESSGTWTIDNEAVMRFRMLERPEALVFSINYYAFDGKQNVAVYCNDVLIKEFVARGTSSITLDVPEELLDDEYLNFRFVLPDAHSPASLDPNNPDGRNLALCFSSVSLIDPTAYDTDTSILGRIMLWCYKLLGNYGWAIVFFTFLTKIILLPLSLWTYFNGITMVKIQPDINFIKVKYYGQKDMIAEEQAKLFKEKKYRPLASVVPTVVQLFLLMGVVAAIKAGISNPAIDMSFGPVNLGDVPSNVGVKLLWSPIVAGIAAFVLCIAQNASSVLQAEQTKTNKWGMTVFSVGLSLYLGWFVSVGTAFYWVCSNLFAVLQLYICNWIIRPRRYVDYERLEESRKQLAEIQGVGNKKKDGYFSENRRRERADYKRFFSVVNKHLVFYSESNGFYKYFKGIIEYILEYTNIRVHYITSDPEDKIFELAEKNPQVRAYYIGENKLITLMMKMDADVVLMTMPDLENFHIKRSYVRDDVEYIFVQHGMGSNNMGMRRGCTDHFDTVFLAGPHQREEEEKIGKFYKLKPRTLVDVGYPLIDEIRAQYNSVEHKANERKKILIAPSWQKDNIVDSCLEELLDSLKGKGYDIIVRPHPQEVRHKKEYMETLKEKYKSQGIEIQTDFSSNNPLMEADLLITDWSGITWEYAFTTLRPIMFINTPMKVMNPEYKNIDVVPLNILLRDKLGKSIDTDKLDQVADTVAYLLDHTDEYHKQIDDLSKKYIYNLDNSVSSASKYIIRTILKKTAKRKEKSNEKSN